MLFPYEGFMELLAEKAATILLHDGLFRQAWTRKNPHTFYVAPNPVMTYVTHQLNLRVFS